MYKDLFEKFLNNVSGTSEKFAIEVRMFNLSALLIGCLFFVGIIVNYFIGLNIWLNTSILICAIVVLYCYWQSRFHNNYLEVLPIFIIASIAMLSLNWFLGSGSNGPSTIYFLLNMIILLIVSPRKQYSFILITQVITLLFLFYIDAYHSDWVVQYSDDQIRLFDMFFTTFECLIFIFLIIGLLKTSYVRDRRMMENQQEEISNQHKVILEQFENLEKINHLKNKLFSIISHDLRSPLSTLHSAINILNETELSEAERTSIMRNAKDRLVHTQEMLDNLLNWANSQLNGMQTNMVQINMKHLVNSVLLHLKPQYDMKYIQVTVDIEDDLVAYADIEMIKLVIRNLASNAIKFTNEDGHIQISGAKINDKVSISIRDNGKGLTPIELNKIKTKISFSTFGTNNEKGTGLGLILCKDFLEVNNGELSVESDIDAGSAFRFSLTSFDELEIKDFINKDLSGKPKEKRPTFSDMY
ncbi:MAG: HAMP domain-containing histidine kinase [Bacteroidetes bacterium]|nr:HAMP domain-containing histidine kinase [Bacteroidota bacterium]